MNVKAQILELEQLFSRIGTIVQKVGDSGELSITARGALEEMKKSALLAGTHTKACSNLLNQEEDTSIFYHYHTATDILEAISHAKHVYFFAANKYFRVYKSSAISVISTLFEHETVLATMSERDGELLLSVHL